ncbi:MAG TPA: hypothetical protein PLO20_10135, partial [Thermogutta sp.]|nr:hypothetical protein [Thermogutta sp.]
MTGFSSRRVMFLICSESRQINRLLVILLLLIFSLGAVSGMPLANSWENSGGGMKKPKNVLILFSDDQRFDTIRAL